MKRMLFIYNPHAGKELIKPKLSDIIDIFVKSGYEVVAYPTQSYRDAYKKVKKFESGSFDLVVCSGGDGTIDEVVTGMMRRKAWGMTMCTMVWPQLIPSERPASNCPLSMD